MKTRLSQLFILYLIVSLSHGIQAQTPQTEILSTISNDSIGAIQVYQNANLPGTAITAYSNINGLPNAPTKFARGMLGNFNNTWNNSGVWGHQYATGVMGQGGLFTYGMNPNTPINHVRLAGGNGVIQIVDGSEGLNKVLTSDAFGNGTWQDPQTLGVWSLNGSSAFYDAGNVGINTDTPDERLDVNGKIRLSASANDEMVIINDDVWNHGSGDQDFGNGGDHFIMASVEGSLESSGIYGDGDHVTIWSPGDGAPGQPTALLYILDEDSYDGGNDNDPFNNNALEIYLNNSGTWVASDRNRKENITKYNGVLNRVLNLNAYRYQFKDKNKEGNQILQEPILGFIAQELREQFPETVQLNDDGEHFVNYSMMVPVILQALKESHEQVEAQQSTIDRQQALIEDLIQRVEALEND